MMMMMMMMMMMINHGTNVAEKGIIWSAIWKEKLGFKSNVSNNSRNCWYFVELFVTLNKVIAWVSDGNKFYKDMFQYIKIMELDSMEAINRQNLWVVSQDCKFATSLLCLYSIAFSIIVN